MAIPIIGELPSLAPHDIQGPVNLKYLSRGIRILRTSTKADEKAITANMSKVKIGMYEPTVLFCKNKERLVLSTDGLGPCLAAMAFCPLAQGGSLMGCVHLPTHKTNSVDKLLNLVRQHEKFSGEKIHVYLAGGAEDENSWYFKNYDLCCERILAQASSTNVELAGILINPYRMTERVFTQFYELYSPKELSSARNVAPDKYAMMIETLNKSRRFSSLLSCKAGITSDGVAFVRKFVDISFDFDHTKYPNLEAVEAYFNARGMTIPNPSNDGLRTINTKDQRDREEFCF